MQTQPFKAAWWLDNPHLQTLYPALLRRPVNLPDRYRERLATADQDFLDLDWCGNKTGPLVILLHGLTGSSNSGYIRGLQQTLSKLSFRSVALNFRGCSGEANHLARCYHSGETEDIQFLYETLRHREPDTPIAVIGFSLGGNVLIKWLGEQRNKVDLFAAVAVSVPFQLNICATKMDTGFSKLYRNNMIGELKHYIAEKHKKLLSLGNTKELKQIQTIGDLSNIKSFWEYDHKVVAHLHNFRDASDFYQRASSRQFIRYITNNTLIIQALDDPFMTADVIPNQNQLSASTELELTESGGHVGFVSGRIPFKPEFWLEQRIPAFLLKHLPK